MNTQDKTGMQSDVSSAFSVLSRLQVVTLVLIFAVGFVSHFPAVALCVDVGLLAIFLPKAIAKKLLLSFFGLVVTCFGLLFVLQNVIPPAHDALDHISLFKQSPK